MQIVTPDLVTEARELSAPVCGGALALGFILWALGWRGHRFWIVLAATVAGGLAGLARSPSYGVQPLVVGLLAAVAAGVLAMELVRVLAFLSSGLAAVLVMRLLAPNWDQPLVSALAGGLLGVYFFRIWMMTLTSILGTTLLLYSSLCLLDRLGTLNSVTWATQGGELFTWAWGLGSFLGVTFQSWYERRRARLTREKEEAAKAAKAKKDEEEAAAALEAEIKKKKAKAAPPPPTVWSYLTSFGSSKKAG